MRKLSIVALLSLLAACSSDKGTGPAPPDGGVASVGITGAPAESETGKTIALQAVVRDSRSNQLSGKTVAWSSSNEAIATVSGTGDVTGAAPGTVTITATSEGKSGTASIKFDTRTAFLSAIAEAVRAQFDLPAVGVAIVTRNGVFGQGQSGRRRISQATQVGAGDLWHIGSELKAITSHVVGIAIAEGVISATTTLSQAYPELPGMRAEYRNVTIRQLLGHVGGIAPNVQNPAIPGNGSLTQQRFNITAWATGQAPTGAGVGSFNYSNVAYMIAANMVERAYNMTWEQVMQTKLLGPLGIADFAWGPAPFNSNQNPIGHDRSGASAWREAPGSDNPPYLSSAGRSSWTLNAWATMLQEVLKADQGQSTLVPQTTARLITTPPGSSSYGGGWFVGTPPWASGRGLDHDGSNNLNYARMQVALDRGAAVMAVTNGHDLVGNRSNDAMVQLTQRLWAYYTANGN